MYEPVSSSIQALVFLREAQLNIYSTIAYIHVLKYAANSWIGILFVVSNSRRSICGRTKVQNPVYSMRTCFMSWFISLVEAQ